MFLKHMHFFEDTLYFPLVFEDSVLHPLLKIRKWISPYSAVKQMFNYQKALSVMTYTLSVTLRSIIA